MIGRARPTAAGPAGILNFQPLSWRSEFTSLPSGHAVTVFAAAVAITSLWPRLGIVIWPYAVAVSLSRGFLFSHNASDVVAGAALGVIGALMVRRWFAVRALAFSIDPSGAMLLKPVPAWARLQARARHAGAAARA